MSSVATPYLVSAIVSTYKGERFIAACLQDLLRQTLGERLEIVVVDSASPQKEAAVVRRFQDAHPNIVYVRTEERETLYAAWNRGIRMARGKYITNANTDDRLRPDAYARMSRALEEDPSVALVYGDMLITPFENQTFERHFRTGYCRMPDYTPDIMLNACHMGPQPMWRKSLHEDIGGFDPSFRSAGDYEFWCRIATRFAMKHLPIFTGLYLQNIAGIVNNNASLSITETESVKKKYSSLLPAPQTPVNLANGRQYAASKLEPGRFANICLAVSGSSRAATATLDSLFSLTVFPHTLTVIGNNCPTETIAYLSDLKQEGIIHHLMLPMHPLSVGQAANLGWQAEPDAAYYVLVQEGVVMESEDWLSAMVWNIDKLTNVAVLCYGFGSVPLSVKTVKRRRICLPSDAKPETGCLLVPRRTWTRIGPWLETESMDAMIAEYGERLQKKAGKIAWMDPETIRVTKPAA
ncbi:MAG: glycosyltransferase [Fibrobacterota bacterium]